MVKTKEIVPSASPRFSFYGWSIWEFIKGRKKTVITMIAAILGFWLTDQAAIALFSGLVVESAWAIAEFYIKQVELE